MYRRVASLGVIGLHHLESNETLAGKARWKLHKDTTCCFEQIFEAAAYKIAVLRSPTYHVTNYPNQMNQTIWSLLEKELTKAWTRVYYEYQQMDIAVFTKPQRFTFICSVWIFDAVWWSYQKCWSIRVAEKSVNYWIKHSSTNSKFISLTYGKISWINNKSYYVISSKKKL